MVEEGRVRDPTRVDERIHFGRGRGLKRNEDGRSKPMDLIVVWAVVVGWKEIGCKLEDRGRVKKA